MWHVYNLIAVSDSVRASTFRKVTTEGATGSSRSQKIRLTLTLEVVDIYFDTEACALRIKGRNIERRGFQFCDSKGWRINDFSTQ